MNRTAIYGTGEKVGNASEDGVGDIPTTTTLRMSAELERYRVVDGVVGTRDTKSKTVVGVDGSTTQRSLGGWEAIMKPGSRLPCHKQPLAAPCPRARGVEGCDSKSRWIKNIRNGLCRFERRDLVDGMRGGFSIAIIALSCNPLLMVVVVVCVWNGEEQMRYWWFENGSFRRVSIMWMKWDSLWGAVPIAWIMTGMDEDGPGEVQFDDLRTIESTKPGRKPAFTTLQRRV